jgi:hypothetical protein
LKTLKIAVSLMNMNLQPENNALVFRKFILISFLILVPLLFLHPERNAELTGGKNTATAQVVAADHGAVLLPAGIPDACHRLNAGSGISGYPQLSDHTGTGFSSFRVLPALIMCSQRYRQIKPALFALHFHPIRSASGEDDLPLIS